MAPLCLEKFKPFQGICNLDWLVAAHRPTVGLACFGCLVSQPEGDGPPLIEPCSSGCGTSRIPFTITDSAPECTWEQHHPIAERRPDLRALANKECPNQLLSLTLCDGWPQMLFPEHLGPTVTKRAQKTSSTFAITTNPHAIPMPFANSAPQPSTSQTRSAQVRSKGDGSRENVRVCAYSDFLT